MTRAAEVDHVLSRAVWFPTRSQVELRTEDVPPPGMGEVVVRMTFSLVSPGTELTCLHGRFEPGTHWDAWVQYPFRPGYSCVGEVLSVGEGTEVTPGTRVGLRRPHQSVAVVPATSLYPVPDGVSDRDATWFGLGTIALNAVRRAGAQLGEDVAVLGLGPLGQLVLQLASIAGAGQVVAVGRDPFRGAVAAAHGATAVVNSTVADARNAVAELVAGGPTVTYDVTGEPEVLADALRLTRRFGLVVLLGDTGFPSRQAIAGDLVRRGLRVIGAHDSDPPANGTDHDPWTKQALAAEILSAIAGGSLVVGDLVTDVVRPDELETTYEVINRADRPTLGVLVDWT